MKKFFVFIVGLFIVGTVFAVGENIPTSKTYVDNAVAQKQNTISATNGNAQVLTNTGTAGTIGTKNIYDSSAAYETQTNSLVTAGTMNTAVQNAIDSEFVCIERNAQGECLLLEIGGIAQYSQYEFFGPAEARTYARFGNNFNSPVSFDSNTNVVTMRRGSESLWTLAANSSFGLSNWDGAYVNGHKYYFYANMRATVPDMIINFSRDVSNSTQLYATTEWGVHGATFVASFVDYDTTHYPVLWYTCPYCSDTNNEGIMIDQNIMGLYDLTAIFGAGNEPATPGAAARALKLLYIPSEE